jgi:hypothetical protein
MIISNAAEHVAQADRQKAALFAAPLASALKILTPSGSTATHWLPPGAGVPLGQGR